MKVYNLTDNQIDEIIRQYELLRHPELLKREHGSDDYSKREPFARDYSRILYSTAFRRLQGKMQILGINSSAFYRNRMTHSLEVSQIAVSIAKNLAATCGMVEEMYNDDIMVIQAAALAHDIGHPAFGHKGERVLNELAHKFSINFEGNAQNFKILRTLEKKDAESKGLNLTWRTLLAINKYNVKEDKDKKKFIYSSDYDEFQKIRASVDLIGVRTLDVQIIELADDIAYAVHDLEDSLSLGLFSIDDILYEYNRSGDTTSYSQLLEIVESAREYAFKSNSFGAQEEFSKVFRCKLTSLLTDAFVRDITLSPVSKKIAEKNGIKENNFELSLGKYDNLCHSLKDIIFTGVMRSPEVSIYELKGEAIIKSLFYLFALDERNSKCALLPMEYRPSPKKDEDKDDEERYNRERIQNSIDYIAGMMDTYAIKEYERYFSVPFDSISLKQVERIDRKIIEGDSLSMQHVSMVLKSANNSTLQFNTSKVTFKKRDK